jgi:hypothetical protein
MSQQNVGSLWHQTRNLHIPVFGCVTHLMNEGFTSLLAIINLFNPMLSFATLIGQLTLSLHSAIESKLKLNCPMTSLINEMHRVRELHSRLSIERSNDRLLLSLVYRKLRVKLTRELVHRCMKSCSRTIIIMTS